MSGVTAPLLPVPSVAHSAWNSTQNCTSQLYETNSYFFADNFKPYKLKRRSHHHHHHHHHVHDVLGVFPVP